MNNSVPNSKPVVDVARFIAAPNRTGDKDESFATKQAIEITQLWQDRLIKNDSERYKKEVVIGGKLNEKIDLVDFRDLVAYELKVSGENPSHEFYKDLFKVLVFNQNHNVIKLQRLVFITEGKGINKLEKGLGKAAADFLQQFNIAVELARLD